VEQQTMPKNPSSTNSRNKILKSGTEQLNQPITRTEEEEDRGRYESRHNKKKKAQMPWSIDHYCFNQQTSSMISLQILKNGHQQFYRKQ
jgi:hypothetical protein